MGIRYLSDTETAPTNPRIKYIEAPAVPEVVPTPKPQMGMAGPVGRGFDAVARGASSGDIPYSIAKVISGLTYGIPELLKDKYISGPNQTFFPSPSIFPKPSTKEGESLGNELGTIAGFVPGIEALQKIIAPVVKPALRKGAASASNRLMTSVLKPDINTLRKDPQLGFKAAKLGLTGSKEKIAQKALSLIDENENKIEQIISKSNGTVDAVKIADDLESVKRPFLNTGDDAAVSAIEKVQNTLRSKGSISVQDAQVLKKDFYSGLKNAYGPGSGKLSAGVKAEKAAARGLREGIESIDPSVGPINRQTGIAGMVEKAATRRELMDQRNNLLGLLDYGLGAGTVASGNPAYLALAAARKAASSDWVKSKLAGLLARLV